jgi:hypothetical protein
LSLEKLSYIVNHKNGLRALRLTSKITSLDNKTNEENRSLNTFALSNEICRFAKVLRYFAGRYAPFATSSLEIKNEL